MKATHQPLQLTFDVSPVVFNRGVSRYTSNLVTELLHRPTVNLTAFGVSYGQSAQLSQWVEQDLQPPAQRLLQLPPRILHSSWQHLKWPSLESIVPSTQVFHAWEWQLAPDKTLPQVVTIHDLAYKLYPETTHPDVKKHFDRLLEDLEHRTHIQIIAVSKATKKDITRLTNIDASRITVVYEALPHEAKFTPSEQEITQTLKTLQLNKPFLFVVGTHEPRKNMLRMIEAWKPLAGEVDLVIAGASGWEAVHTHEGMHVLGYVDAVQLSCLYRSAQALVYASLYEGFGLPILEAYYHDCPVITSAVSSLPEVAGDAALLVDPYSTEALTEACRTLLTENAAAQKRRSHQMQQQLNVFSWQRAADETEAVYRKAL